jgi:hypothetical protein
MNPLYYTFVPIFVKAWKAVMPQIKISVILINDTIPEALTHYKEHITLFRHQQYPELQKVNTAFISQTIRTLYPALLNTSDGVIITDIDMVPLNATYYTNSIKDLTNDKFVCYRNILQNKSQLPICYNVATPKIWKTVFGINTLDDVVRKLASIYSTISYSGISGKTGWSTDQLVLFDAAIKLPNLVVLNDKQTGFSRLDRIKSITLDEQLMIKIKNGFYSDYHMKRPYLQYRELNDGVVNQLLNTNKINNIVK